MLDTPQLPKAGRPHAAPKSRWLILAGCLLLAVVLAAVFWDWNWLRPLVEREASMALGRPVTLRHFAVEAVDTNGWHARVVAADVTIANPAGFDDTKPFASIGKLSVGIDVVALLRTRSVAIEQIRVEHARVDMREDAAGVSNWVFPAFATPVDPTPANATSTTTPIKNLQIIDAQVHVVVPSQHSDFALVVATGPTIDGTQSQVIVDVTGTYAAQPISGRLVSGGLLSLRDAATPFPVDIHLINGATRISLNGTVIDPLALSGANLKLELSGTDMALLMPFAGFAIPKTPSFHIAGALDFADGKVLFQHFTGIVGSSDIEGDIAVAPGKPRPVMTGTIRSRTIDLADLGGVIGSEPGRMATPNQTPEQRRDVARAEASPQLLPTIPINLPVIRQADIHLVYHGDKILGQSVPFDTIAANLDIDDGRIRLTPLTLGVGSGKIVATLDLTPQGHEVHTVAEISFQRLDVGRLLAATHLVQGSGVLGGKASLTSTGNSVSTLLGHGDGTLQVFLAGGGDVSALLVDISGFQIGKALLSALGIPNREPVHCFVGDFALEHGILHTQTFLLDTKSNIITGAGTINLATETLALRLKTDAKHFSIGTLPAPFTISGPFKDPSIGPDIATLGARAGAAVGLGVLFLPAALLPTIQFGVGSENACVALVHRDGGTR